MSKKKQSRSTVDDENIATGIEKIFERGAGFLVWGLTGRTGSGCSTVADELLSKSSFPELQWRAPPNPPATHEDRKDRIVEHWLKERWVKFRKIQVSRMLPIRKSLPFSEGHHQDR